MNLTDDLGPASRIPRLSLLKALGRYASVAQGPGFTRAIASVVMELRLAKVEPDRLGVVAADLATLLRTYESNLAEGELTDWAGVMIYATAAAASGEFTHQLVGLPILLLDVSLSTEAELALVCALGSRATEMLAVVPAADEPTLSRLRKGLEVELEALDGGDESPGTLPRAAFLTKIRPPPRRCRMARSSCSRRLVKAANVWRLPAACSTSRACW